MSSTKAIVFGPTGGVGSAVARAAHALGAHVTLAMRDVSKPIPGIANADAYTKVQADLTQPDTVSSAVRRSGAQHAFIYCAHQSSDHMTSTIRALKDSGITLVVFLSSFSVSGDLKAIQPERIIDYLRAQVELNLKTIFGQDHFIVLRAGSFASNELQYKQGFKNDNVRILYPRTELDCIVPEDIGRVGGTFLATGRPADGEHAIPLFGPQILTAHEAVATVAKVLGKNPKVTDLDEAGAREVLQERGLPPPFVEYFIRNTSGTDGEDMVFGRKIDPADLRNVEKYSGVKATTFEQWVRDNREKFESY